MRDSLRDLGRFESDRRMGVGECVSQMAEQVKIVLRDLAVDCESSPQHDLLRQSIQRAAFRLQSLTEVALDFQNPVDRLG